MRKRYIIRKFIVIGLLLTIGLSKSESPDPDLKDLVAQEVDKQLSALFPLLKNATPFNSSESILEQLNKMNDNAVQRDKNLCIAKRSGSHGVDFMTEVLRNCSSHLQYTIEAIKNKFLGDDFFQNLTSHTLVLLGPPGVGKTTLAEAVACYCGVPYTFIKASSLATEYINSGPSNLNRIFFPILDADEPHIIIIDELQTIIKNQNGKVIDEGTAEALWLLLDECKVRKNIFIIATANDITKLPHQLQSRLSKTVYEIKLPALKARERILSFYLKRISPELLDHIKPSDINDLAKKTRGFSIRDLESIVEAAVLHMLSGVNGFELPLAPSRKDFDYGYYHVKKHKGVFPFIPEWCKTMLENVLPSFVISVVLSMISISVSHYLSHSDHNATLAMNERHHLENMQQHTRVTSAQAV